MSTATYDQKLVTLEEELKAIRAQMIDPEEEQEEKERRRLQEIATGGLRRMLDNLDEIRALNQEWRKLTFHGHIPNVAELGERIWNLFSRWISTKVYIVDPRLEALRHMGVRLDRDQLARLRKYGHEVSDTLMDWQQPASSMSPAFRTIRVSQDHPLAKPCPRTPGF